MGDIKSAWEKAMEKAEKLGKPSEDELKRLEHIPTGNTIAAKYLNDDKYNLESELVKYKDTAIRQYIVSGVMEIFLRNITLPHDEREKYLGGRAMSGIRIIKTNRKQLDVILEQLKHLMNYYEQARQQAFIQFKGSFESKLKESGTMMQQMVSSGINIEAQIQQQFQDEWRKAIRDLDIQYERALEDQKQQIANLS